MHLQQLEDLHSLLQQLEQSTCQRQVLYVILLQSFQELLQPQQVVTGEEMQELQSLEALMMSQKSVRSQNL